MSRHTNTTGQETHPPIECRDYDINGMCKHTYPEEEIEEAEQMYD